MWFGVILLTSDSLYSVAVVTLSNLINYFESHYSSVKVFHQSVFSREIEPVVYIYTHTHTHTHICVYIYIFFKKSVHLIVGAGMPEICRTGWQARNLGRS